MEPDRERWDERYADRPLAEPAAPIAVGASGDVLSLIPSTGRAADIACGTGGQTLWLAARGLVVAAFDVSPVAIEMTMRAAEAAGLGDRVTARVHDLDEGLPAGVSALDVLICQRYREPALYGAFVDALVPGGIAIVTVLSRVGIGAAAGPFRAPPCELVDAFRDAPADVIYHHEAEGQASIVVRRR